VLQYGDITEVALMPVNGQPGSTPSQPGTLDEGLCSFCAAPNSRASIACNFCGSRLPWTFEKTGKLNLESKIYLGLVSSVEKANLEASTIDLRAITAPGLLPNELNTHAIAQPLNSLPLSEEIL